jgi:hypothetical protein
MVMVLSQVNKKGVRAYVHVTPERCWNAELSALAALRT